MKHVWIVSALLLNGCATSNETFDCEPSRGVGCVSLSHVNAMVDQGHLPLNQQPESSTPLQISQKNLRVWIAGHTDDEGLIHAPSVVHVPLREKTP